MKTFNKKKLNATTLCKQPSKKIQLKKGVSIVIKSINQTQEKSIKNRLLIDTFQSERVPTLNLEVLKSLHQHIH